jgi:hypothetical protein
MPMGKVLYRHGETIDVTETWMVRLRSATPPASAIVHWQYPYRRRFKVHGTLGASYRRRPEKRGRIGLAGS